MTYPMCIALTPLTCENLSRINSECYEVFYLAANQICFLYTPRVVQNPLLGAFTYVQERRTLLLPRSQRAALSPDATPAKLYLERSADSRRDQ